MGEEAANKGWLQNLPAILAASAALLTAVAGLVAALSGFFPKSATPTATAVATVQNCMPGYQWREAYRGDHVCVTADTHMQTMQDNELAGSRRNPQGGAFGPDSCASGYVWREAFDNDHVCVTPQTRDAAKQDNEQAALRIKK